MKKALITGITGQDGSYLAEVPVAKSQKMRRSFRLDTVSPTGNRHGKLNLTRQTFAIERPREPAKAFIFDP